MRALLLAAAFALPAAAASPRPVMAPHGRLDGRPAPAALAQNLINGSNNVRALAKHLAALDREDPRQNREWVTCVGIVARESSILRHSTRQGRVMVKNGVELDSAAAALSFEPGKAVDLPGQEDADGARVALALSAVEEAEPLAAAIILRAQGADELDRISAYEAAADEASGRVREQRAHLASLVGEKGVDVGLESKPGPAAAGIPSPMPDIMRAPSAKPRREP